MQFFCTEAYITVFEGWRKGSFCKIEDKNYSLKYCWRGFPSEAFDAVVELDAEGIERHGDHIVLADGEDHVHELPGRIALAQGRPAGQ